MYDISQLNDLLVPELLDIADELHISNAKKLNKQDLIVKILDKQTHMSTAKNDDERFWHGRFLPSLRHHQLQPQCHAG